MISKKRSYEKKRFLKKSKSGQSQIVASVLLILIVIATVVIIMNFVIPFVRNQLSGADCLDVAGKISIQNNPKYTCIKQSGTEVSVQVHVGDINESLGGFMIELGGASSKSFEIRNEEIGVEDGVSMYEKTDEEALELPGKNEERTYIIVHGIEYVDFIKVYPLLLNDKTCDSSDIVNNIGQCS